MYKSKIIGLVGCLVMLLSVSCSDDDFKTYTDGGVQKIADPFLQIVTPVVSFQAGTPQYDVELNLINGLKKATTVNVYTVYTDAATGLQSDRTLLKSYSVSADTKEVITDSYTYADLSAGVTVNGAGLPSDDNELAIGSGWKLSFEGTTSAGDLIPLLGNINIAVLHPWAGNYTTVQTAYFRIGVESSLTDWSGETRFIGSVDGDTFSYNDFWGPFGWGGASFNFDIDFTDNTVTVPIIVAGLFSGNRALNCTDDAAIFTNVPCTGSNRFIEDTSGADKHILIMTYGYFTDGSGAREFYEVLEKQ